MVQLINIEPTSKLKIMKAKLEITGCKNTSNIASEASRTIKSNRWYDQPCIFRINIYVKQKEIIHQCNQWYDRPYTFNAK